MAFWAQATQRPDPFASSGSLPPAVCQALDWVGKTAPDDAIAWRERATAEIEQAADRFRNSGESDRWLRECDSGIAEVLKHVNLPLLQHLIKQSGWHDPQVVDMLRNGAQVVGMLPSSGTGTAIDDPQPPAELPAVGAERRTANEQILSSLTEDRHASELLKQIWEIEVPLGRMSAPVPVSEIAESLDHVVVNRRFGVEQGIDANGDIKIRSVDDCTESLVNAACAVRERLHHDGLDSLVQCAKRLSTALGHNADLSFFKADVDAAYRRVPVASSCLNLVWIVFLVNGITWASCHRSLAFGLVAAVHAWNRVGACLTHICRQLLKIPLLRYVDDLFAVEPSRSAPHALSCVARVIRAVLGTDALRAHKMAVGNYSLACQFSQWTRSWSRAACAAMQGVKVSEAPLVVLGASVSCLIAVLRCCPSPDKAAKWSDILLRVIATGIMSPGLAKKMAGRLSWAAQTTFRRAGRAMVRPFFAQAFAPLRGARASPALLSACHWWQVVLRSGISEAIPLRISLREPVILLTGACFVSAHRSRALR